MKKITISAYDFFKMFPDEESAKKFFEERRWKDGITCPLCSTQDFITVQNIKGAPFYSCGTCRKFFTVRTGTIMHRSHIPLNKWLYAMYLIVTCRKGISSLQLSKEIGITQKSTWFLLQRIRASCKVDLFQLCGVVEVDETYIGGKQKNKRKSKRKAGRGTAGKTAVVGARERGGKVIAIVVKNTKMRSLQNFIHTNIKLGSTVYTDDAGGYTGLKGYSHSKVNHSAKQFVDGDTHTNSIESVWALLKRSYYGTFHHFSIKHLQLYVNEVSFRLNEGEVKVPTINRMKFLTDCFFGKRLTYKELIA